MTTGEVVQLAEFCASCEGDFGYISTDGASCFVDDCVPPGDYRYGYESPFACEPAACGTYFYAAVSIDASVNGCRWREGNSPPLPHPAGAPWPDDPLICGYAFSPDAGPGVPDAGPGVPDAGPDVSDAGPGVSPGDDNSRGCSTAGRAPAPIFAMQLLLLALGLLVMHRRRC